MLKIFDCNNNYWLTFEECEWGGKLKPTISVEIESTDNLPEKEKLQNETIFMMNRKDAEYLHAYLSVFLKNNQ